MEKWSNFIVVNHFILFPLKVMATHPYQGEDDDELSFEKGDVILVVPYEDPDDEVRNR